MVLSLSCHIQQKVRAVSKLTVSQNSSLTNLTDCRKWIDSLHIWHAVNKFKHAFWDSTDSLLT